VVIDAEHAAINAVMAGCKPDYFRWWPPRSAP
jgi:hypothetical protein